MSAPATAREMQLMRHVRAIVSTILMSIVSSAPAPARSLPPVRRPAIKRGARDALLYACAIAGPAVWFTILCTAWELAPSAHEVGRRVALLGLHVLALAFALAPGAAALREVHILRRGGAGHHPAAERARLLAGSALALSAVSALLVLASALPLVLPARPLR
jgi:hypothetical protein